MEGVAAMIGLAQLPAELQIHICSYLENTDLKAVRSVCKDTRNNATPELFRSLVICCRYKGLGAFEHVSKNEVLRKYVKEIIFDGSKYEYTLARSLYQYERSVRQYDHLKDAKSWISRNRWKRYREMYDDQEEMLKSLVLLHTVAKAIQFMPKLCRIVYSSGPRLQSFEKKELRDLIPPAFHPGSFEAFHHVIGAIHCEQFTSIREFAVAPFVPGAAFSEQQFSLEAFRFKDADHLEAGKFFFHNLHKLHLDVNISIGQGGSSMLDNMARLLCETTELRELSLHLTPWKQREHSMYRHVSPEEPIFPRLGLRTTWTSLRMLSIGGVYANEGTFKDLVDRHRYTLKSLRFELCGLTEGNWTHIVDEVVLTTSIPEFSLDRVHDVYLGYNVSFEDVHDRENWWFDGQLMVNEKGERYFEEPRTENKKAYVWPHGR